MNRPGVMQRLRRAVVLIAALVVSLPALSASLRTHGIGMRWNDAEQAIVVGTVREDSPRDIATRTPPRYSVEIESVVFGDLRPGQVVRIRDINTGRPLAPALPMPIGERAVCYMNRLPPAWQEDSASPLWSMSATDLDFMGPDGTPFCLMGPEAEAIIREAPRMIEIAKLLEGKDKDRWSRQRAAVWEEWRKGEMRPVLVLEWIIYLHDKDPALRAEMLDFLETVVDDRTLPSDCRLMAEFKLASKRPEYANQTARRAARLVELLADPNLSEQARNDAEYVLADLTRRLEAEKAPAAE